MTSKPPGGGLSSLAHGAASFGYEAALNDVARRWPPSALSSWSSFCSLPSLCAASLTGLLLRLRRIWPGPTSNFISKQQLKFRQAFGSQRRMFIAHDSTIMAFSENIDAEPTSAAIRVNDGFL